MRRLIFILIVCFLSSNHGYARQSTFRIRPQAVSNRAFSNHSDFQNESQVIRLFALRVEFQPEDNVNTTGDGTFDLNPPESLMIDSPPYDKTYFEHQCLALANYYKSVSKGKLLIEPAVSDQIFRLDKPMGAYNPNGNADSTAFGLARLFKDAIEKADESGILFSDFDVFILFHAGVGNDFDFGYNPTPQDIPSAFLNLESLQKGLGESAGFPGISVQNGNFFVKEGLVLPSTQNQKGYEIGLLGTMTLMFGFQLGLPALWDTETGRSGIGRWGLMDQGSGNFYGLIPSQPNAWEKVFMGWEEPVVLTAGADIEVASAKSAGTQRIIKIPVNTDEYFLVENRQHDMNGDSVAIGRDAIGNVVRFRSDGMIEVTEGAGVIVEVDEYDFGTPGSGILIWHIDESVIREKLGENKINSNRSRRGVVLKEADGAQDIGEEYGMLEPGSGSQFGAWYNAWFEDNEPHMMVNKSETVAFTPDGYPSSRSNTGGNSHIIMTDFSKSDSIMTFTLQNQWLREGFPVSFEGENPFPPLSGKSANADKQLLITAAGSGDAAAWDANGHLLLQHTARDHSYSPSAPFIGFAVSSNMEILIGASSDALFAWSFSDDNQNGYGEPLFTWTESNLEITATGWLFDQAVTGTSCGRLTGVSASGNKLWETDLNIGSIRNFCQFGNGILVTASEGIAMVDSFGSAIWSHTGADYIFSNVSASGLEYGSVQPHAVFLGEGFAAALRENLIYFGENRLPNDLSGPALADWTGDGNIEALFTGGSAIWCFHENGSLVNYFPMPAKERGIRLSAPIIADVNGDGSLDVLFATSEGNIEAWSANGRPVHGFPLTTGCTEAITPAFLNMEGNNIQLAAATSAGRLFVWDLPGIYSETAVPWPHERHDSQLSGQSVLPDTREKETDGWFPENGVYNYPNPAVDNYTMIRYTLKKEAAVTIQIFNMLANPVMIFKGAGTAHMPNELMWNLDGVRNGIYFCKVTAIADGEEKTVTFKIAVAR